MAGRKVVASSAVDMAALVVALLAGAAVSGAAGAGYTVCGVDLVRMERACRSYCAAGSREAQPRRQCCDAVRGADFRCLCRYRGVLRSIGGVDAGRAMQIPSKCSPGAPTSC